MRTFIISEWACCVSLGWWGVGSVRSRLTRSRCIIQQVMSQSLDIVLRPTLLSRPTQRYLLTVRVRPTDILHMATLITRPSHFPLVHSSLQSPLLQTESSYVVCSVACRYFLMHCMIANYTVTSRWTGRRGRRVEVAEYAWKKWSDSGQIDGHRAE